MKTISFFLVSFIAFWFSSCNLLHEQPNPNMLKCVAVYRNDSTATDTVFFTEETIEYFDTATCELKIKSDFNYNEIMIFSRLVFYLQSDSLFIAQPVTDIVSSTRNDLVLHYNLFDNKLYLEDGYPMSIDNLGFTTQMAQNKAKRAANWKRFVGRLKVVGKLR